MAPPVHLSDMDSSQEILDALKGKGITQAAIASVLGVAQPNVSTLFNPVKRTGKPRDLSYDEGVKLIRAFALADGEAPTRQPLNENVLARLLHSLGPSLPKGEISEKAAQALAVALTHALELLEETGATDPTDRELAMAARAAMSRFREASRS